MDLYSTLFTILLLLFLLALGQRIAFALGIIALVLIFMKGMSVSVISQTIYSILDNFVWAAIPMFVIMGETLVKSGIARDMYKTVNNWIRHIPGGLGVATITTCALFAAVSGTSIGTVAALGAITVPEMISRKHDKEFAYGCLACGGTLGILIPPSITMIIYGVITEVSIEKLFIAGVVPGLILTFLFSVYCIIYGKYLKPDTTLSPATWRERFESSGKAVWGLLTIIIVLGGIYTGVFTVTESAAIGSAYAIFVSILIYKNMTLKILYQILRQTVITSTMIFVIVSFAMVLASIMSSQQVPQMISGKIINSGLPYWGIIILYNIMFFVMGCFFDVPSIMLITLPIIYPTITEMGFSHLWFAVIMTMNMEVATITPPVGLNIYVLKGVIPEAPVEDIIRGCIPFVLIILLAMIIVGVFPILSTWLPSRLT